MINLIRLAIVTITIIYSCKSDKITSRIENEKEDTLKNARHLAQKSEKDHYKYDSTKSTFENFNEGYMDTFSINGSRFQFLLNPNSRGEFELQVMKNEHWVNNLNVPYAIYGSNANHDINEDGLNDFICSFLHGVQVYLFDDTVKQFCKEPIYIAHDWSVIDSARKLYSNNYAYANYWQTDLFLLKDLKQTFLYNAVIDLHIDSMKEPGYVHLYKLKNGEMDDTTLIGQSEFDNLREGFDYKAYWKKFAKRNIKLIEK